MSQDSLPPIPWGMNSALPHPGGSSGGGNDHDDLNDLMEVFNFDFDGVDANEAQALERELWRGDAATSGSSSLSAASQLLQQQNRRMANGSPVQLGQKEAYSFSGATNKQPTSNVMDIESSGKSSAKKVTGTTTIPPATVAVSNGNSGADEMVESTTPVVAKQKRGRKKKEEIMAMTAAAVAAGIPMPSPPPKTPKDSPMSGGANEEEKERLRRENNKQSARNSRKKKKEYVLVLSESIASLTKEVQQLRENLARKSVDEDRREKLACIGRNAFLHAVESHGPNSAKRRISAIYQFENLTRNVAPPHTRFLLWSVARKATEADSPAARTWQEVSSVIGLQPEQQGRFSVLMKSKKATDNAAAEERDRLQFVFNSIQKLRSGMDQSSSKLAGYQTALLDILTPVQQALLFQWIEESQSEQAATSMVRSFAFQGDSLTSETQKAKQVIMGPSPIPSRSVPQQEEATMIDFLLNLKA